MNNVLVWCEWLCSRKMTIMGQKTTKQSFQKMELTACRVYSEFLQVARGHWSEGILLSKLQQIQEKWSSSLDQDWASLFISSPEITALVRMWLIFPICSYSHTENGGNDWRRGAMNLSQLKSWTDWEWPSFTKSGLHAFVFLPMSVKWEMAG